MIFVKNFIRFPIKNRKVYVYLLSQQKCKDVFETDAVHLRQSELMQKDTRYAGWFILMKKLTGILMAVCLASSLIAGCGQKAGGQNTQTTNGQSAAQTESQTTGNPSETGNGNGEEKSAAQHCILLAVKNGTWLLADRDNGAVFTAEIPSDLTDESGKKISSEILKAADYVDVYGDGIMLQSYPGQYPGVSKMVVTGEGSEDELKQYHDVIDMVFADRIR